MGDLSRNAQQAIAWAKSGGGGQSYPGLCDHFVALAYGQAHSGYDTALQHWDASPNKHTNGRPDVGALVYFNTGKPAGHVAIVSGYDKAGNPLIVTTHTNGGKPTEMRLDQSGLDYLGWAAPDFQGKTTETIAPENVTPEVAPAATGSNDVSGIDDRTDVQQFRSKGGTVTGQNVPDKLSPQDAAKAAGVNWNFVQQNPDVLDVFKQASKEGWFTSGDIGKAKFTTALQNTPWYQNNSEFARSYLQAKATGGQDFTDSVNTAKSQVRLEAARLGADVDDTTVDSLAEQYLMNGWDQGNRAQFLSQALTSHAGGSKGQTADIVQSLKGLAAANGVQYSDDYYLSAARAIDGKLGTLQDYETDIRKHAASANPIFADKILGGANVKDLASPYITKMADTLEISPDQISLSDPFIQQALGGVDKDGNPSAMGLWDFQKALKQDPRWQYTKQASDQMGDITQKIISMFGFGG